MKAAIWLRRYAAHPDPLTSAANFVALVVAGNGPFYPVYVMALIGWDRAGAWLSMLASPLFFAVPAISRLSPRAGRAALPLIGIANAAWCAELFGSASGVGLFLLPCITLAMVLLCADDRWLALSLAGSAIACLTLLTEYSLPGLMALPPAAAATLTRLNLISVATLTAFVALTLAKAWQLHPSDTRRRQPRC
jgi:hypothetical protein